MASVALRNPSLKCLLPSLLRSTHVAVARLLLLPQSLIQSEEMISLPQVLKLLCGDRWPPLLKINLMKMLEQLGTLITAAATKVIAEVGKANTIAFDKIDKAPEEKKLF